MTYTTHKLNDHQLTRLSAIINNRPHRHGMSLVALINRGLVVERPRDTWRRGRDFSNSCDPTPAGCDALVAARAEGW